MEREKFVAGCEATGYGSDLGTKLFDIIEPFADYAFNKSHAFAYGMVAYQTAWLKANHPVEYLAALLTSVKDDKDKTAVYLAECRTMGVEVLVPDVNLSIAEFGAVDGKIPFGMAAIRNVGEGLVGLIVAEREKNGPFADFYDFCRRVDPGVLNKRSVESLIKAGAFDSMGHPRRGLLAVFEQIIDRTLARRREQELGVMSLFGEMADGPSAIVDERIPIGTDEFDQHQKLAFEKEMLGLYVSSHPLFGVESVLRRHAECTIAELRECRDGETKWVGGVVTALSPQVHQAGRPHGRVHPRGPAVGHRGHGLPPHHARARRAAGRRRHRVRQGPPRPAGGAGQDHLPRAQAARPRRPRARPPSASSCRPPRSPTACSTGSSRCCATTPGTSPSTSISTRTVLRLPDEFRVDSGNGLVSELRVLLGPNGLVT